MSALVVVIVLGALGAALVVSGIYIIAGQGAALLLGGALLFVAALIVRQGMRADG